MRVHKNIFFVVIVLLFACNPDIDYEVRGYREKIIVEASIESGKYAQVELTLNVPLWKTIDSSNYLDRIIRDAKVTIIDDENAEVLTAKWDRSVSPPRHYYIGNEIKGAEGKIYDLLIEKGGYTLYSTTSIPSSFQLENIVSKTTRIDDFRSLEITIDAGNDTQKAYRIFTKKKKDTRYIETPIIFNDALNQSGEITMQVSPHPESTDPSFSENNFFAVGDTVAIRICAIDSVSTQFYKDLAMFSVKGGNIIVSEVKPLNSNISEPGFGIWCGSFVQQIMYVVK